MCTSRFSKWTIPALALLFGLGFLAALWAGGKPTDGLEAFGILAATALVFALGGRSETLRGLRGDGRDEYWRSLDEGATMLAGGVVVVAVIVMSMWEWAHGRSGSPYIWLGALFGAAYAAALAALRLRR